jgi:acyl-CoA synthetase (AMP-forming)/AMP-acid ligase II
MHGCVHNAAFGSQSVLSCKYWHAIAGATWVADPGNPNHLVPIGAVGELLLQGPLVGRGYLNNPEQTAAAFIPGPP